jgi:nitroreductase
MEVTVMDVFEAISARHSYRGAFSDEPVPREDLVKIVQAGIQAPSGCNAQTTSFVVVDEPALLREMAAIVDSRVVHSARAVIVCAVEHRDVYRGMSFGVEDCAAAVENMLLAVTALGYATVWIDGALRVDERAEQIAALLSIPDELQVRVILPLGRPVEYVTQKEKNPFGERAWFNQHGSDL